MSGAIKCARCGRRFRRGAADAHHWNGDYRAGVLLRILCPACQTVQEYCEAAVNEATLDYATLPDGRGICLPKTGGRA